MTIEGRSLVFLGTPVAAATVLERLLASGVVIDHVVTQPDAKRGRGSALSPSPVKEVAQRHNIPVSHDLTWIQQNAERGLFGIVVAYGRIIPSSVLNVVPMINIHFSLLPRWRGAAPVERALMAGDAITGVCIMDIEPTLDTGAVYARREVAITHLSTAQSLTAELADAGADLLVETLRDGLGVPIPQGDGSTHAAKITREELRIDWTQSAIDIHRRIRAVRAYSEIDGMRLRILEAEVAEGESGQPGLLLSDGTVGTGRGSLQLRVVQPEGKSAMDVDSWLRGRAASASSAFTL